MALAASRARTWRASTCCAPRRASSSKATSSTGGMPPIGPRRPHADLRRPRLAALRRRALPRRSPATRAVLDEPVPFLEGPALAAGRARRLLPARALGESGARCSSTARARSTAASSVGAHGLPLIGTGDWNDGMNRVGARGQGRERLARLVPAHDARRVRAARRGARRAARAPSAGAHMPRRCERALERDGWDGDWYRRAYFDDGTPLGSAANDECRIDSIAQSWSVHLRRRAIRRAPRGRWPRSTSTSSAAATGWSLLFTPPFDQTTLDPGYIKGYLPGIRENGGQYTHARDLVGASPSPRSATATRPASCSRC